MLKSLTNYLFRNPDEIGLDSYLVLVFCFLGSILGILGTVINLFLGFELTMILSTILTVIIFISTYFYSRLKQRYTVSKYVIIILSLIILNFQWFINYGSSGPILYLFVVLESFMIVFFARLERIIFTLTVFVNVAVLFLIEYYYPESVGKYSSNYARLIDLFMSLVIYLFLSIMLLNIAFKFYKNQRQKAEQSDKLKSAFLANMSHEIRTPMNGILGFTELLKDPNLDGKEKEEFIEIIQNSGDRMLSILNDIIDISKIESGLMKLDLKESDIDEQLEFIYNFFKPEIEKKGLCFSINSVLTHKTIILVDREKLFAILINLVKNAVKFTQEGRIEFGYNKKVIKDRLSLQFFVKDTGIGIPVERQAAIFERFIQADISNQNAFQGAGLGLSISKAYVEMLGGKIWVESEPEKGSVFYFTIPYDLIPDNKIITKRESAYPELKDKLRNLKILIVDDDEISLKLITLMVRNFSSEVFPVRTGSEAIKICQNNSDIDLVFMDIQLPGIDGYETTKQIRQFNTDVIIIAQTAFALTGDREKSLEAGCNDYITKPIDKNQLISIITTIAQNMQNPSEMQIV